MLCYGARVYNKNLSDAKLLGCGVASYFPDMLQFRDAFSQFIYVLKLIKLLPVLCEDVILLGDTSSCM